MNVCVWARQADSLAVCARGFCPESLAGVLHHGSLPFNSSVREKKRRKLSESENSQWAGRSDSCCAATEVGWLLGLMSNYRINLLLPGPHIEMWNVSLLWEGEGRFFFFKLQDLEIVGRQTSWVFCFVLLFSRPVSLYVSTKPDSYKNV